MVGIAVLFDARVQVSEGNPLVDSAVKHCRVPSGEITWFGES